jgi:hypothetical protein
MSCLSRSGFPAWLPEVSGSKARGTETLVQDIILAAEYADGLGRMNTVKFFEHWSACFWYPQVANDPMVRNGIVGGDPTDVLAKRPDKKLQEWGSEVAEQVRREVVELIELADRGLVDIARLRKVEQEVLDLIDEPKAR